MDSRLGKEFFKKEIRSDFLIDEKRKKVWAVVLEMLEKFDQVCKAYHLTYWVFYGTLLGAVRHKGFIPWDDDIDVVLFRDDYETFQSIAPWEFEEPYFFQNSYTDHLIWPFSKIRDSRTTGIEFVNMTNCHQGIFIDIFPLDSVMDGVNQQFSGVWDMQRLLWDMVTQPGKALEFIKGDLVAGRMAPADVQNLLEILKKDVRERFKIFEKFSQDHFGETQEVNYIMEELRPSHYRSMKREWFRDTVYLPFEHLMVPVPVDYDQILTQCYGNYHELVQGGSSHGNIILDPDMPYDEYFSKYLLGDK
ncbi:MAG: LicD family protein [Hungatella sp.]|nr:LicD family protein [Hungatella sp.]